MAKSILRSAGAIVGLGLLFAACSGTKQDSTPIGGNAGGSSFPGFGGRGGGAGSDSGAVSCMPGAKRCDGLTVKVCDATGDKESIAQTCLPSQACSGGTCVEGGCVPNSQFCKDGAVWACDENGAATLAEQCAFGLSCRVEGDSASCNPQACSPNQPVCNKEVATLCRADGSGPTSGGVDCSNTKQACYGGQCREIACTNGERLCDHGSVYLCAHSGTDIALLSTCRTDEVCDPEMGACRTRLCDAGKVSCDGTRVQTCNAFGSAWLPGSVECAMDGKICVNGSCKKQVCAANRNFCQDGNAYGCDATGTLATLKQTCNSLSEHCSSSGYCVSNDCHAGDKLCVNNVVKTCNADGSLPSDGTVCGDTQICENAQCKERPCVPYTNFCKGADVYYCDYSGSSQPFYLQQQCVADTTCKLQGSYASCVALPCSPTSTTCIGNKIGTCGSDGQSLSAVTTDCTATANLCTPDLKCAKSAIDNVGVGENLETLSSGSLVGNVFEVDSARKLTELQLNVALSNPRELRWVVYEMAGQTFVPKLDKVVSNVTGIGFVTSGALSFNLVAGKRYMLGVVISGGDGIDSIDTLPFSSDVSFGTAIGRVYAYYPGAIDASSYDPNTIAQMKVMTDAP